jgi:hypothetical protein
MFFKTSNLIDHFSLWHERRKEKSYQKRNAVSGVSLVATSDRRFAGGSRQTFEKV